MTALFDYTIDPRFIAAVKLLERTGSASFRIGYTDENEDGKPVIWHATVEYRRQHGIAFSRIHEVDAALDPVTATLRLCERVIDGGRCAHCGKSTVFAGGTDSSHEQKVARGVNGCLYAWDPELETFRRDCEGDKP